MGEVENLLRGIAQVPIHGLDDFQAFPQKQRVGATGLSLENPEIHGVHAKELLVLSNFPSEFQCIPSTVQNVQVHNCAIGRGEQHGRPKQDPRSPIFRKSVTHWSEIPLYSEWLINTILYKTSESILNG